jgi:hypothetical protein
MRWGDPRTLEELSSMIGLLPFQLVEELESAM